MRKRSDTWKAGAVGPKPRHLLAGLARCTACGGPMKAVPARFGSETIKLYVCSHHRERGTCKNTLRRPVAKVDAAVVEWLRAEVLTEDVIAAVLVEVRHRLAARSGQPSAERGELEAEAKRLRSEIDRLVMALASGVESPTIATVIGARARSG